jgi:hypothetical protein
MVYQAIDHIVEYEFLEKEFSWVGELSSEGEMEDLELLDDLSQEANSDNSDSDSIDDTTDESSSEASDGDVRPEEISTKANAQIDERENGENVELDERIPFNVGTQ